MDSEYNNWKNGIYRYGARRRMNRMSGWINCESEWVNDEYYVDMYSYY